MKTASKCKWQLAKVRQKVRTAAAANITYKKRPSKGNSTAAVHRSKQSEAIKKHGKEWMSSCRNKNKHKLNKQSTTVSHKTAAHRKATRAVCYKSATTTRDLKVKP